ncbi:hypothetical protein [Phytoactinopolyspora limicola]|uniref:hypothetical protein n=1 Tax=Phytoactinopolyspora limicola TaxID=2715536 RepID=UPI00140A60DF|nr:hypothetical protein [Phytoactinopolyspora limicola]
MAEDVPAADAESAGGADTRKPWWRGPRGAALACLAALLIVVGVVLAVRAGGDDDPRAGDIDPTAEPAPRDTPTPDVADGTIAPDATDDPRGDGDEDDEADGDDDRTSDEPETDPDTTSLPDDDTDPIDPADAVRAAEQVLGEYLAEADVVYQNPQADLGRVARVADGVALSEVQAAVTEFGNIEWRQRGEVRIAEVEPGEVDVSTAPETVELEACLDTSAIDIVDDSGESVRGPADSGSDRTLHVYRVQRVEGTWLVVDHGLPDDADC